MGQEFRFDLEVDLVIPPGSFPVVRVHFRPPDGQLLIFGYLPDSTFTKVVVEGPQEALALPFNRPKLFLRRGPGVTRVRIEAVGWQEPDQCGAPPFYPVTEQR